MANQKITDYLKRQKKYNYTKAQLRGMCLRRGYDEYEIGLLCLSVEGTDVVKLLSAKTGLGRRGVW